MHTMPEEFWQYAIFTALLGILAVWMTIHYRTVQAQVGRLQDQIKHLSARLESERSNDESRELEIEIISPSDHKPSKPSRVRGKTYTISNVAGLARGAIGAAYLIRHSKEYDPVPLAKLDIVNGAWKCDIKLPDSLKANTFEIYAVAMPEPADFPLYKRIHASPKWTRSNAIPVQLKWKDEGVQT